MAKISWREIPGFPAYEICSDGQIKSRTRHIRAIRAGKPWTLYRAGKLLRPEMDRDGYLRVTLSQNGKAHHFRLSRLVASAFIPNPLNLPEVAHLDHNRLNNTPGNLKWTNRTGNHSDSVIEDRYAATGPLVPHKRIFTAEEIRSIRRRFEAGESQSFIARTLNIRIEQVRKIIRRERWAHV